MLYIKAEKRMKAHMIFPVFLAAMLSAASCEWTEPEKLNFRKPTAEESDPDGYAVYLQSLREYKQTDHKVMILTMEGTSAPTSFQWQHPMSMPDSADIICISGAEQLNTTVISEIDEVRQKKGTKSVMMLDFESVMGEWEAIQDEKVASGEDPGGEDDLKAFFTSETSHQISICRSCGFDGVMVSFEGNTVDDERRMGLETFLAALKEWNDAEPDALLLVRGTIVNIPDTDFLSRCMYHILEGGTNDGLISYKGLVSNYLGSKAPQDRVVFEVTVPSAENPVQQGSSPRKAAETVMQLSEPGEATFVACGLCVSNAQDDYYTSNLVYGNIRPAITVMNTVVE